MAIEEFGKWIHQWSHALNAQFNCACALLLSKQMGPNVGNALLPKPHHIAHLAALCAAEEIIQQSYCVTQSWDLWQVKNATDN